MSSPLTEKSFAMLCDTLFPRIHGKPLWTEEKAEELAAGIAEILGLIEQSVARDLECLQPSLSASERNALTQDRIQLLLIGDKKRWKSWIEKPEFLEETPRQAAIVAMDRALHYLRPSETSGSTALPHYPMVHRAMLQGISLLILESLGTKDNQCHGRPHLWQGNLSNALVEALERWVQPSQAQEQRENALTLIYHQREKIAEVLCPKERRPFQYVPSVEWIVECWIPLLGPPDIAPSLHPTQETPEENDALLDLACRVTLAKPDGIGMVCGCALGILLGWYFGFFAMVIGGFVGIFWGELAEKNLRHFLIGQTDWVSMFRQRSLWRSMKKQIFAFPPDPKSSDSKSESTTETPISPQTLERLKSPVETTLPREDLTLQSTALPFQTSPFQTPPLQASLFQTPTIYRGTAPTPADPRSVLHYHRGAICLAIHHEGWYIALTALGVEALLRVGRYPHIEAFRSEFGVPDAGISRDPSTECYRIPLAQSSVTRLMDQLDRWFPGSDGGLVSARGDEEQWPRDTDVYGMPSYK